MNKKKKDVKKEVKIKKPETKKINIRNLVRQSYGA